MIKAHKACRITAVKNDENHTYAVEMVSLNNHHHKYTYRGFRTRPYVKDERGDDVVLKEGTLVPAGIKIFDGVGYCPECGSMLLHNEMSVKNSYECPSGSCTFSLPSKIKGHTLSERDVTELLAAGETRVIPGLKKNAKQEGKGVLYLDENNLVQIREIK